MEIKKYLPFENYTLITKLSITEVYDRISKNVEIKNPFSFPSFNHTPQMPFNGQVNADSFKIRRNINYRNSFLPIISGKMSAFSGQTIITIKMRLSIYVSIFISIWLGFVGLFCLGFLIAFFLHSRIGFVPMMIIPFAMFIFGCLLTSWSFKKESKISKEYLASLFEGHEVD